MLIHSEGAIYLTLVNLTTTLGAAETWVQEALIDINPKGWVSETSEPLYGFETLVELSKTISPSLAKRFSKDPDVEPMDYLSFDELCAFRNVVDIYNKCPKPVISRIFSKMLTEAGIEYVTKLYARSVQLNPKKIGYNRVNAYPIEALGIFDSLVAKYQ